MWCFMWPDTTRNEQVSPVNLVGKVPAPYFAPAPELFGGARHTEFTRRFAGTHALFAPARVFLMGE